MEQKAPSGNENEKFYTVPDPVIHPMALQYFGYTDADMFPVSKNRAMELMERDVTVFLISTLNTEQIAKTAEDILLHDGLFGVTKQEWESVRKDIPLYDIEKIFRENSNDAYAVYQLSDKPSAQDLLFMNLNWHNSHNHPVKQENYNLVYTGELLNDKTTLEDIYFLLNENRPADFTGHSLSVSDVVALKQDNKISYHFCDSFGFTELPDFGKDSPLKNAEMLLEDDYSMLDGRINNGKPALTEEKKLSILEKLKTPPEQPILPKTPSKKPNIER